MRNVEHESGGAASLAEKTAGRGAAIATFVVIVLAAIFLRFYKLGAWSFWADEVFTIYDSRNLSRVRGYPVGYFLIGLVLRVFDVSEFSARLLPAVAGIVSVPVLYWIGRHLYSRRTGLIAAGLLSISCFHIYYSQYARYYTLLMLFGMLAMWFAFLGIERNSRGWIAAAVAGLVLAFLTHWTAGLLIPALGLTFLWLAHGQERPAGANRFNAAVLLGPFVVGGVLLTPVFVRFLRGWSGAESFSVMRAGLLVLKVADRIEPAVILCALVGGFLFWVERDYRLKWLAPYALVPPAVVVIVVAFSRGGSRFAIVCLPAWLLLAAYGLDRLIAIGRKKHPVMACVLVACVAVSLLIKDARYFTVEMGQRPPWKEAVRFVKDKGFGRHNEIITNSPALFSYYFCASIWMPNVLADYSPSQLEDILAPLRGKDSPAVILVEHTSNVAPTREQWRVISEHCDLVESYPLYVRFLDYSISIYVQKE